jgi:hypothetical protein
MIVVHVTHEAVEKVGGIGTVIAGLMTAEAYQKTVSRTILLGPLFQTDRPVNKRLGDGGHVIYSSLDAILTPPWMERFRPIERTYDVGVIYGKRKIADPCCGKAVEAEVLLLDVFHSNKARLDLFKAELFNKFAVPSDRFEKVWEYEEYVRLAEPGFEAVKAIGCNGGGEEVVFLAHEYMGMPTALKVLLSGSPNSRTVFYAHEVASVRPIVEKMPGHDTMFYNLMGAAAKENRFLEDLFPEVAESYKHPLVKAARYLDHVFAVGDYVEEELRFLDPHFRTTDIDLVYNGIPAMPLTLPERQASRERMATYAGNLFFGRRPTWTFTHVARPVLSKGIWRDLRVLHFLDPLLAARGESAVFFMLGTLAGQRRGADVRHMEKVYGWPVRHERGYPDLCQGEEVIDDMFAGFNREHKAVRAVFVNQWDWNAEVCGDLMPADMTFGDARRGTDLEFGLSVYEPFGISQLEPLSFGALCVVSNVCGCMGFARRVAVNHPIDGNIIEADFLNLHDTRTTQEMMNVPISVRDQIETEESQRIAAVVEKRLPRDAAALERMIVSGYELAQQMSWEKVVKEYFLPSLSRTVARK